MSSPACGPTSTTTRRRAPSGPCATSSSIRSGLSADLGSAAAGRSPSSFTLAADPAAQFETAATAAMTAWRAPGVLDKVVEFGPGPMPGTCARRHQPPRHRHPHLGLGDRDRPAGDVARRRRARSARSEQDDRVARASPRPLRSRGDAARRVRLDRSARRVPGADAVKTADVNIGTREEWLRQRVELLGEEKALNRRARRPRGAPADASVGARRQGVRVRRRGRREDAFRALRQAQPAAHLPLHVRTGLGRGLSELLVSHRLLRRHGHPSRPSRRHARVRRATRPTRSSLPIASGWDGRRPSSRRFAATSTTTSTCRSPRARPRRARSTTSRDPSIRTRSCPASARSRRPTTAAVPHVLELRTWPRSPRERVPAPRPGTEGPRRRQPGVADGVAPPTRRLRGWGRMSKKVTGTGTADDPWVLQTPPGTSEFQMHRDDTADPAGARVPGRHDEAALPGPLPRRRAQDVEAARRLDGARQRRREQAGQGGHARGVGSVARATR